MGMNWPNKLTPLELVLDTVVAFKSEDRRYCIECALPCAASCLFSCLC